MTLFSKSIWNSRPKLGVICVVLLYFYVMVQVWKRTNEGLQKGVERNDSRYDEDLNDALEGIKYMKDLVRGTADIAPVVAKPQTVIEYSHCGKLALSHLTEIGWVENEDFYLFSAYYDRRMNSLFPANHIVQVLGMHYRTFNKTLFCTLQSPYTSIVVRAGVREIWQRAWDPRDHFYIPYLISCPVPRRLREEKDLIVAVSTDQCLSKSTTALIVHFYPRESQNPTGKVAVCVKGLDFLDNEQYAHRFVEWMELQLILGADTVAVYTYSLTEEMFKVLAYYEEKGKLKNVRLKLPGESPNLDHVRSSFIWRNRQQKRRHELIPYNDCLYRHIDTHDYVLIVDTDEIVVPLTHASWTEMIESELSEKLLHKATSISIRNVFKFPSANTSNPDLYTLKNHRRSATMQEKKDYGKSFVKTNNVATVFNHFALHRQHGDVSRTIYLDPEIAVKLHYKESCPIESRKECPELIKNTVEDHSLDTWAKELRKRVNGVFSELGM